MSVIPITNFQKSQKIIEEDTNSSCKFKFTQVSSLNEFAKEDTMVWIVPDINYKGYELH